jgi:hypothetical protein
MPAQRRTGLDFVVAGFEMLHDRVGDLVLLVLRQRSAHAATQREAGPQTHHHGQPKVVCDAPHPGTIRTN